MKAVYFVFTCFISFFITILSQSQTPISGEEMTSQEKDKILACVELVSRKFQKDEVRLNSNIQILIFL